MTNGFRVLGPLEATRDGEPLRLGGGKQSALLAILLLNANEVVSSDRLIDELWGETPPETAGKALQVHVSQLRKVLEPERGSGDPGRVLITRSPGYMLALEPDQLDLTRFDRLAREGREALASDDPERAATLLRDALSLWRGPPLADLAFESFAQSEIARLEELRLAALEDRIAADLECGRHADVVGELESLVRAEPLRERPRGQLMLALYRSGRQADALDTYRSARETLVEKLGIEPGKELQGLHEAILRQDASLDLAREGTMDSEWKQRRAAAGPEAAGRAEAAPDFVGRERELGELEAALVRARSGHGGTYLIGGEPGIGKSRLAAELGERAHAREAKVLWGRCWEAGGAPAYWPWVQSLRAYVDAVEPEVLRDQLGPRGGEVAHVLPELREVLPDLPALDTPDSQGARFRVFDATSSFLERAGSAQPLVFVLEDLHAADASSLLLLEFIAKEIAAARVLIVGTYRDIEVERGNALSSALVELNRQRSTRTLLLRGVSERDVSPLIEISAGVSPPPRVAAAIHRATGGNPLFVEELGRLLAAEGRLDEPIDNRGLRLAIPHGLRDVIARRLERVSDPCRETLRVASVLGREFTIAALAHASAREPADVLGLLDEAIRARVAGEAPGAGRRMRFSHVLIRDALYDELGVSRRMQLHREIGDALAGLYRDDPDRHLAELAHHYLQAAPGGDVDKAIDYAWRAGDRAAGLLAYEEAARLYEMALEALALRGLADEPARCELLLALGDAQVRGGDLSTGKETFARAAEIAGRLNDPERLGRAALGYGGRFVWFRAGRDRRMVPMLEAALDAQAAGDSVLRAKLLARLAGALRDQPVAERRTSMTQEAVEIARRMGDRETLAYALEGTYAGLSWPKDTDAWLSMARELTQLGQETGDKEKLFSGHLHALGAFMLLGDPGSVDAELQVIDALADELRQPAQRWAVAVTRMMLALFVGRLEDAELCLGQSVDLGARAQGEDVAFLYVKHTQTWGLRREQGRLAEALPELTRLVERYPTYFIFRCLLASAYAELGHEAEARAELDRLAADDFADLQVGTDWFFGASLLAGVCAFLGDAARAARLHEALRPFAGCNVYAHPELSLGSAARNLGLLASTMSRWEEADAHFKRAIEMNASMGARPWVAHTHEDYARMLIRRGALDDAHRASELLEAARGTYQELGMDAWEAKATAELPNLA